MDTPAETYISFYLRPNRIHVFIDALRGIGCPNRICFMMSEQGDSLLIAPYEKKDFRSHQVPNSAYNGIGRMEVSSRKLCRLIARKFNWKEDCSYRVPGIIYNEKPVVIFDLTKAARIGQEDIMI
ncbi:MAG: hypothetical protein ACOX6G_10605 [Christensenellales bacterium]|jgi:hypothetical protein